MKNYHLIRKNGRYILFLNRIRQRANTLQLPEVLYQRIEEKV